MLGPAEHFSVIVYLILNILLIVVVVVVVVIAVGTGTAVGVVEQVVAVADADVVAELVEDGIETFPFPLLKRPTLGY